ncbi:MAG: type II toxin-antitoxin system Phd/YefM family antitoxin, partial [Candidatus Dormibacteraceae bacterium]
MIAYNETSNPEEWNELNATQAKNHFGALLEHVRDGGTTYITRNGRKIAALVPVDAAEYLERLEDEYWGRRADEVLATTSEDEWIPMEQV